MASASGAGVGGDLHDRLRHVAPADADAGGERLLGPQRIGGAREDEGAVRRQRAFGFARVVADRHHDGVGRESGEGGVVPGQQGEGPVGFIERAGGQKQPLALGEQLLPARRDLVVEPGAERLAGDELVRRLRHHRRLDAGGHAHRRVGRLIEGDGSRGDDRHAGHCHPEPCAPGRRGLQGIARRHRLVHCRLNSCGSGNF
jgi:hypothetical protein